MVHNAFSLITTFISMNPLKISLFPMSLFIEFSFFSLSHDKLLLKDRRENMRTSNNKLFHTAKMIEEEEASIEELNRSDQSKINYHRRRLFRTYEEVIAKNICDVSPEKICYI